MSDYGTRLAGSANSGAELGVSDFAIRQDDRNYHVSYTPNKKVKRQEYRASPIAFPVATIMDETESLFLRKHEDYGPDGIASSPFGVLQGLLTRMHDKHHRAIHLVKRGHGHNYEPLEDCFRDLMGYSIAAIMVLRGDWPGVSQ